MGEAEAVYRLLPSMTLKKSNVQCQWVSLGVKEERSSRWMKAMQEDIDSGRTVTEIVAHNGLWYEQQDIWSKYLRRSTEIEDICFAQFAKMYKTATKRKADDDSGDDNNEDLENQEIPDDEKFHYIMTHRSENEGKEIKKKLPKIVMLTHHYPRESPAMQKRSNPAVLRFNKAKDDPLRFMLHELMLYRPTRKEFDPEEIESMYDETYNGERKVDIVKRQVILTQQIQPISWTQHWSKIMLIVMEKYQKTILIIYT